MLFSVYKGALFALLGDDHSVIVSINNTLVAYFIGTLRYIDLTMLLLYALTPLCQLVAASYTSAT